MLGPEHLDLLGLRLLDPEDHLGLLEDGGRVREDRRALRGVRVVRNRAALARAGLEQDLVAVLGELARAGRA